MKLRFASLLLLASTSMAATAHAGDDNGFWVDNERLIAKTMSSSVEFGFDGWNRYITLNNWNRRNALTTSSHLGYEMSYPGSGRTQWVSFDFVGSNVFGTGLSPSPVFQSFVHMPIFLRAGSFHTATVAQNLEGKGIFLGHNDTWGSCGTPASKARIFFETRIVNTWTPAPYDAVAGVKCADGSSDKYFEDEQQYHVDMHVNDNYISYWIYLKYPNGSMVLWSASGTEATDYLPYTGNSNAAFVDAKSSWLPREQGRMNDNNLANLSIPLPLLPTNQGPWYLRITNLSSGRF